MTFPSSSVREEHFASMAGEDLREASAQQVFDDVNSCASKTRMKARQECEMGFGGVGR